MLLIFVLNACYGVFNLMLSLLNDDNNLKACWIFLVEYSG